MARLIFIKIHEDCTTEKYSHQLGAFQDVNAERHAGVMKDMWKHKKFQREDPQLFRINIFCMV